MFISLPSQSNPIQDVYHHLNQLQERVQNVYHRSDQFQPVWNVRGEFPLGAHPATPPFTATINLEATTDHLSILSRTPLCNTIQTLFHSEQSPPLLPSYTLSRTSLCQAEEALVCRQCSPPAFLWKTIALHPPLLFPLEEAHSLANNAHQSWSPQVSRIRIGYSPGERLGEASSTRLISMYMSPPASAPPLLHCP